MNDHAETRNQRRTRRLAELRDALALERRYAGELEAELRDTRTALRHTEDALRNATKVAVDAQADAADYRERLSATDRAWSQLANERDELRAELARGHRLGPGEHHLGPDADVRVFDP